MASRIILAIFAVIAFNQMMTNACILSPLGGFGLGACGGALSVPIPPPIKLPLVIKPLLDLGCDGDCSGCGAPVSCAAPCGTCGNSLLLKKLLPLLLASSPSCGGCGGCGGCRSYSGCGC